ncbi:DNA adenine methylase [Thermocoleostomius sinensis A174]|uniref:site-specific DNA-methyltransferase (adenine-specific) n=1 Tax=Thermocoleostomius sinensis A174 TaxID=2016057 RepID=A0A9E8ZG46_9CYAN|nr:DNA adenine methylase [Thermocoleostomius sinensis A174]
MTIEEFEYLLGLNRRVAGMQDKTTKLYKTPPSPDRIQKVQELCEQMWGTKTPTVLDAFAGGGSIPFEAARYGLNVLASDLNPVAVVTMKAAIEYPLKFGADLQVEIDKWVKWVGDEAEKRLAPFFPSLPGEKVQAYFWAHTVMCPNCQSVVPLSPTWWVDKSPASAKKGEWCAVYPISDLENKRVCFEMIRGKKGSATTIQTSTGEYDPLTQATISRGTGRCLNCGNIIEDEAIKSFAQSCGLGDQLYAVAFKKSNGSLQFRIPVDLDFEGIQKAEESLSKKRIEWELSGFIPTQEIPSNTHRGTDMYLYGIYHWQKLFNDRQLLTLATYVELINEAKEEIQKSYESGVAQVLLAYLALAFDRCVDRNSRLGHWSSASNMSFHGALAQHSLNLMWNYYETTGSSRLWQSYSQSIRNEYSDLCSLLDVSSQFNILVDKDSAVDIQVSLASADSLIHIANKSIDVVVTDPPYYDAIRYGEISDFFYVWLRANLLDIFPNLFFNELTDKDNEAIANPGRFRNMGASPEELANQDYEAKMALAFAEYYRVLRDDGVMTVQFNHKDSGAWDVLAKSLIDAGFEITASWAVSTENPQNLHQAQKNSVSSTVLLVCRKRAPNAGQAWWDDLRPDVANLVEQRAPEFEANDITGIDLYLSAFGPALNVFSRNYPILDSSGNEVRPEEAFAEARRAIANYRFRKLAQTDTAGFDPLTTWYMLAWDAFRAREFPFDDARQLALAVGGFNVADLAKTYKLLDSTSGTCKFLTPQQRHKKRAFSLVEEEFSARYLIDALHAIITLYLEEQAIEPVRRFLKSTGLLSNDLFMRSWEVALKVIPRIGDERKRIPEEKALADLWLAMDEIKAKVVYVQPELDLGYGQQTLNFDAIAEDT